MSKEQKAYLAENGIEHQTYMPDSLQQNGRAERFQQTIINGAEAMRHHTGLSNDFWIYTVKAKLHTYNVRLIKRADYKTVKTRVLCSSSEVKDTMISGVYQSRGETGSLYRPDLISSTRSIIPYHYGLEPISLYTCNTS